MKVLVAVKRVVDYNVKVRAKADGSDVELNNVKPPLLTPPPPVFKTSYFKSIKNALIFV